MIHERAFFLHIPRTGGTSLTRILMKKYGAPKIIGQHHLFLELVADKDRAPKFISGHFYAHQLPDWASAEADIFTVMRNPIDRLLSAHKYCRRVVQTGKVVPPNMKYAAETDFLEYAFSEQGRADRHMALYILGLDGAAKSGSASFDALLERAKERLQTYHVIVTDQIDTFASASQADTLRLNTTETDEADDAIRRNERLNELLRYDFELYNYAVGLTQDGRTGAGQITPPSEDVGAAVTPRDDSLAFTSYGKLRNAFSSLFRRNA